ncbi:hypothetical protein BDW69DRAFT_198607 [Aspergillus filifer]
MFSGGDVPDPEKDIQVSLLIGDAPNSGGSVPHIALWDEDGNRFGQYKGDENGHLDGESTKTFSIHPDQNNGNQKSPAYVLLVMQETDAICLSAIVTSGNSKQHMWTGDMGYTCGAQWYHSEASYGDSNAPIRCVWLDSDHSNGIIAKGLSLHMPSFASDQGLVNQYRQDQRRLCQNTARMTFQPEPIVPDSLISFFKPAPKYRADGGLKRPNQGIDRKTRAYPDGTNMHIHDTKRSHVRDWNISSRNTTTAGNIRGLKNNNPDHLIISSREGHSARELCDHPNSLGPDFVDKVEGLFCDMETGKVWPLCDDATGSGCFDLETREFRAGRGGGEEGAKGAASTDSTPVKSYTSYKEW